VRVHEPRGLQWVLGQTAARGGFVVVADDVDDRADRPGVVADGDGVAGVDAEFDGDQVCADLLAGEVEGAGGRWGAAGPGVG